MSTKSRRAFQPAFEIIQDKQAQIREQVHGQLREAALGLVHGLFLEEIDALCGKAFSRKAADGYHRGGSDPGSEILHGQRVRVRKPRVKSMGKDVGLTSYAALQDYDLLDERVMRHMLSGVSTREYDGLLDEIAGGAGLKKSAVSAAFLRGSRQALDAINGRDLSGMDLAAVMIDGIEFAKVCVVVAMGITTHGEKVILGLRRGETENAEVCKDLLAGLIERGLRQDERFLFILDGAKALKKAVRKVFGEDFPIQRCIRHKERNVLKYLPESAHAEFRRRFKLIHGMNHLSDAQSEMDRLLGWLSSCNHAAAESLEEAEGETLTVIAFGVTAALRKTLLSTNPIESAFSRVRSKTGRVRRWRKDRDQIERWAGAALRDAEKRFQKIRGAKDLPSFVAQLRRKDLPPQAEAA
jgi:transposase-like protein